MQSRAIEETVFDNHIRNRPYNPNTIARAVDDAVLDEKVVDVAACDGIIAGEELTVYDVNISAGPVDPAAEVDAVPAARDLDATNIDLFGEFYHNGVVCRVLYRDIADSNIAAVAEDNRVGATHSLLAAGIEHLVAIDNTMPDNVHVLDTDTEDKRTVPRFTESRLRRVGRRRKALVIVQFGRADQSGAGLEEEGYVVLEMDSAGKILARAKADLSAACVRTGRDA